MSRARTVPRQWQGAASGHIDVCQSLAKTLKLCPCPVVILLHNPSLAVDLVRHIPCRVATLRQREKVPHDAKPGGEPLLSTVARFDNGLEGWDELSQLPACWIGMALWCSGEGLAQTMASMHKHHAAGKHTQFSTPWRPSHTTGRRWAARTSSWTFGAPSHRPLPRLAAAAMPAPRPCAPA